MGRSRGGRIAVEATRPDTAFVLEVGDSVVLHDGQANAEAPCLRGEAVALVEALSIRAPLPTSAPPAWAQLLSGLAAAFDAPAS